ncbi:hypothetical protein PVAP13_7NG122772 [Panicum virgatum]|uniref:Uncharacterized protein n=1 Tax=Panicum virgatum TaxID=38727 RepID=A0A8T0QAN0_PANVG|nr:hypothetical protein PVAP13_7NG122772 [Panicum virgatum]
MKDKLTSGCNLDTRAAKKLRTDRAGKTLIPQSAYHGNSSNCSEIGLSGRNKGKDISDSEQIVEAILRRISLTATGSSVVNNNSSNMDVEQGWRTTHNHTSKLPISLMGKLTCSSQQESESSTPSSQDHGSGATIMASDIMGTKTIMIGRGRRKHASTSSHPGESSIAHDEPGASFVSPPKIIAGRNRTSHRHDIPVITIDDITPEARSSSSGYSNGTSVDPTIQAQLESDELLARQLQEQLYNESPRFAPTEEMDAIVAMSLQHEEDTHPTSSSVRRFPNNSVRTLNSFLMFYLSDM